MPGLYETDVLTWSERQAALLRRVAAGERINDQVDWENVVEEIESVGIEQLHAVESYLMQALLHDLKAQAWPHSREVPHWQAEARLFRWQAKRRFAPSMRQRIDLPALYADAIAGLPDAPDGEPRSAVVAERPFTLEQLLSAG